MTDTERDTTIPDLTLKPMYRMPTSGRFAFHAARWEDMPTQYPIVNRLAALPLLDFNGAVLTKASAGGDVSSQRIIR